MKEINLLPRKNVGFLEQERTIFAARAIAILSVIIVISSFVAVVLLGKNYSVEDVQAQQSSIRSRLQPYKAKAIKQLILFSTVSKIQSILASRASLNPKIIAIQKQLSPDITIQTFMVSTKEVTMSVSSPSLISLKTFLDALTAMVNKKSGFSKVTITNVIVDPVSGNYTVNVDGLYE